MQLALIENLQREDLKPLEEAQGYHALMEEHGFTQEEVSKTVGKSRPAITNALRLLNLPEDVRSMLERGEMTCRLELRPVTGRTHQLRLHCAHMGYPILGDPQYGTEESKRFAPELKSQLLCAKKLEFCHPVTGESLCLVSGMDAEF
jgi:23S rRNA-/tRNA-specific pseudouridylate synthase